jgi:glutaredoxin 3
MVQSYLMKVIKIYTKDPCPYCDHAKNLLNQIKVPFEEIDITNKDDLKQELSQKAGGWKTVPMIWIGDKFIGGFDDMLALHKQGQLKPLIEA